MYFKFFGYEFGLTKPLGFYKLNKEVFGCRCVCYTFGPYFITKISMDCK